MKRLEHISNQLSGNETSSAFGNIPRADTDPTSKIFEEFDADQSANKLILASGTYYDDNGLPYMFESIKKVEQRIVNNPKLNKDYSSIDGDGAFCLGTQRLLFGENNQKIENGDIFTIQTIAATGALRIGFDFVKKHLPAQVLVPTPTWVPHLTIIRESNLTLEEYPYYDAETKGFDFTGMMKSLEKAPEGAILLLHSSPQNPTGLDPTKDQWREILKVIQIKKLVPFWDCCFQGFASGDLDEDAWAMRLFLDSGLNFLVAQSFSKIMGLYGERAGALHVVCSNKDQALNVATQIRLLVRPLYSNPPLHPARLVGFLLSDPQLLKEWKLELRNLYERLVYKRKMIKQEFDKQNLPGNWDHLLTQMGMFFFTGLNEAQCKTLKEKYHIHLGAKGRLSLAKVTSNNVSFLASSIKKCL